MIPTSPTAYDNELRQTVPYFHNIYSEAVDIVRHTQGEVRSWLDTGCGTGNMVREAYNTFRSTRYLLADPAEEMLMQARMNLMNVPQSNLMIVRAACTEDLDLTGFPCPQVITAILSHHYCSQDNRINANNNCYQMLADGGVYITVENILPLSDQGKEIALKRWIAFQIAQGKSEDESRDNAAHFASSIFPITIDKHMELLKSAGFRAAETFWLSHMHAAFYAIK